MIRAALAFLAAAIVWRIGDNPGAAWLMTLAFAGGLVCGALGVMLWLDWQESQS